MDTRNFFKFIYAIYNGYHRNINAMCDGKLDIEDWGRVLAYKRKAFEECAFSYYIVSQQFRDKVGIYYNKFKESLANYEKSHWFDCDFDINKERKRYFEQKYHIIRRREITLACDFLEKLLNEPKLISNNDKKVSNELFHYNLNYNEEQFKSIYTFLVDGKYLESTTALNDFIYYFSGKGDKPKNGLKWIDKKVNLAQFIDTLCNKEKKKWVIAELIFGEDGLRQSNGNTVYRKNDNNHFEDLKNTLKKK